MTIKEKIETKIQSLDAAQLNEVCEFVERLADSPKTPQPTSLMSELRQIKINGPEDFSTNIDLYLNGEKSAP